MKCDSKLMLRIGIGIGALLAVAYGVFPSVRPWIVASGPLLLFLICPLTMFLMMKGMNACTNETVLQAGKPEASPTTGKRLVE